MIHIKRKRNVELERTPSGDIKKYIKEINLVTLFFMVLLVKVREIF